MKKYFALIILLFGITPITAYSTDVHCSTSPIDICLWDNFYTLDNKNLIPNDLKRVQWKDEKENSCHEEYQLDMYKNERLANGSIKEAHTYSYSVSDGLIIGFEYIKTYPLNSTSADKILNRYRKIYDDVFEESSDKFGIYLKYGTGGRAEQRISLYKDKENSVFRVMHEFIDNKSQKALNKMIRECMNE